MFDHKIYCSFIYYLGCSFHDEANYMAIKFNWTDAGVKVKEGMRKGPKKKSMLHTALPVPVQSHCNIFDRFLRIVAVMKRRCVTEMTIAALLLPQHADIIIMAILEVIVPGISFMTCGIVHISFVVPMQNALYAISMLFILFIFWQIDSSIFEHHWIFNSEYCWIVCYFRNEINLKR